MKGLAIVGHQHRLDWMDHHQGIELLGRDQASPGGRRGPNLGQVSAKELEPVEVELGYWDSKKWTIRDEVAKRLTTAQRVGIGIASTRIHQPYRKLGESSQVHAGPIQAGNLSQPCAEYPTADGV